jgi:ABC-type sugar transport system permease subunit
MTDLGYFLYGFIVAVCIIKIAQLTINWLQNHNKFSLMDHLLHIWLTMTFYMLISMAQAIKMGPITK